MAIDAINVTRYPRDGGPYTTEMIERPGWEVVEREVRSMHNWEKPLIWVQQDREVGDRNCMAVCGGSGVYHVQIADEEGRWWQAVDPEGSEEVVEVWVSDQGFSAEAKFTWAVEKAVEVVRWYYERGERHQGYTWA